VITNVTNNVEEITQYQGAHAVDPVVRNDGTPLEVGDLYFNTVINELKVWTGTDWVPASPGSIAVQNFTGTGAQTAFNLASSPVAENNTQIYIDGVYQQKDTYTLAGATINFSTAPPYLSGIEVVTFSIASLGTVDASNVSYNRDNLGTLTTVAEELDRTTTANMVAYELGTTAAVSAHAGIATGYIIRTNYYDSALTSGSGAEHRFTGTTTAGKAGNWPDADGYFYDVDGKQFAVVGSVANVLAFGAVGDGVANDTASIIAAAKLAAVLYFPKVSSFYAINGTITIPNDGVKVCGEGRSSKIKSTGTLDASNVFYASGRSDLEFCNLYIEPGTTVSSITHGGAINLFNSTNCRVHDCEVTAHRTTGIGLRDCSNCFVTDNYIHDSVVNPATDNHTQAGGDIKIFYNGNNIVVSNNIVVNGAGISIIAQTIVSGDVIENCTISNNIVKNSKIYGIMLYKLNFTDELKNNVITGNVVDTVYGNVQDATYGFVYGTGIYNQGAEHTIITDNFVRNTNVNTLIELLAPGAIGVTNSRHVTISNNVIMDPVWYGIALFDPNQLGLAEGAAVVTNNQTYNSAKAGIYGKDFPSALIENNRIYNATSQGIFVTDVATTTTDEWIIQGNSISSTTGQGIIVSDTNRCVINNNIVTDSTVHGISVTDGLATITGNIVTGSTTYGISLSAGVTGGICSNNVLDDNGYHFLMQSSGMIIRDNRMTNHVIGRYLGAFIPYSVLTVNDTTPSVGGRKYVVITNTVATSITTFDDGVQDQEIHVVIGNALSNTTFVHSSTLLLAGNVNYTPNANGDIIRFVLNGSQWSEIGRVER
jgi:parallel beta-helix repeat protein